MVDEHLRGLFSKHPEVLKIIGSIEENVADGRLPAVAAVQQLIEVFEGKRFAEGTGTRT